jgi:hypothetical protein
MPGTNIVEDIELIIEDIGGRGGKNPPPGGDDGDEGGKRRGPQLPSSRRYAMAIAIGIVSIVMFFMPWLAPSFISGPGAIRGYRFIYRGSFGLTPRSCF